MKYYLTHIFLFFQIAFGYSQSSIIDATTNENEPFFREIATYPDNYSAATVALRVVDALGFRYYWATEGLRPVDLEYRPTPEARSSAETVEHISGMILFLAQSVGVPVEAVEPASFEVKRTNTLDMLKATRDKLLHATDEDLEAYQADFGQGRVYPFWNLLNGQITDCIWHCGQIASFRRTSGNPINPNVSFFNGVVVEE